MKIREIITEQRITPAEISEYLKKPNLAQEYRRVYGGQFNKGQLQQAMINMAKSPGGGMISSVEQLYGSAAAQVAQAQKPAAAPAVNTGKTATLNPDRGNDDNNKKPGLYNRAKNQAGETARKVARLAQNAMNFAAQQTELQKQK